MMKSFKSAAQKAELIAALIIIGAVILAAAGMMRLSHQTRLRPAAADVITVVIDAGHGGDDPGCVCDGIKESDINLRIALLLAEKLRQKGFIAILTREKEDGLYLPTSTVWDKQEDMLQRKNILCGAAADLFICIHQNSYADTSVKGAQVFFNDKDGQNELLANNIQTALAAIAPYENNRQALCNNEYYLLRNSPCTAVIVECGFLTNEQDRALLCDDDFTDETAQAIYRSVCLFFGAEP